MGIMSPGQKSKFSDPQYLPEGEEMFREKFSENLLMVEDIITTFGDENKLEKSAKEAKGFKKFLFTTLEAMDIDVSDYIGRYHTYTHSFFPFITCNIQVTWK